MERKMSDQAHIKRNIKFILGWGVGLEIKSWRIDGPRDGDSHEQCADKTIIRQSLFEIFIRITTCSFPISPTDIIKWMNQQS
jgi:hypothetical protein